MYRKNVASQSIFFTMVNATTGAADTGATVTVRYTIDSGGTQQTGGGTTTNLGNGQYRYVPTQAETNGNQIGFFFTATNDVPVSLTIVTTAGDPTDAVRFGLTALPNANAAAAGGLHILGTNATAVSYTAGMTISNAGGTALTLSSGGSNGHGLSAAGNGTGGGITATGGATGHGINGIGGATSGNGIRGAGTAGNSAGVNAVGQGSAAGLLATGGATGAGVSGVGGATSGVGISGTGTAGNSQGILGTGQGSAAGIRGTGGVTGNGIYGVGGATSGAGIRGDGTAGNSTGIAAVGQGSAAGLTATGGATGSGVAATGTGTGHGIVATSGTGATGDGLRAVAASTNGNGLTGIKTGSGSDLNATSTPLVLAKTTNITGFNDIAATAVVSAGAITTSSGAVSNVTTVNGLAANTVTATAIADNAITAAKIATDAIGAAQLAADAIGSSELATTAVNEIRDAILSDSTPFAGANVNATISSRATQTTADAIEADTQDIQARILPAGSYISGTINDAGPLVGDFDGSAGLSTTDNFYQYSVLVFTSGALAGLSRQISAYTGATRNLQFTGTGENADAPWPTAPANGDAFVILGRIGT